MFAGNIVWVNGQFADGKYHDVESFRLGLVHWLDEFERVEADDGYIREAPQKVKCSGCTSNLTKNKAMQNHVRSRHKLLNGRFIN